MLNNTSQETFENIICLNYINFKIVPKFRIVNKLKGKKIFSHNLEVANS